MVQKTTGRKPKELEALVDFPVSMQFVWKYFIDLSDSRTLSMNGVNPITYSDIKAYFELHKIDNYPWEVDVIKKLDKLMLEYYAQKAQAEHDAKTKNQKK